MNVTAIVYPIYKIEKYKKNVQQNNLKNYTNFWTLFFYLIIVLYFNNLKKKHYVQHKQLNL